MLSIFSYVSGPSVCLPWRSVCSSPLPIFVDILHAQIYLLKKNYCYSITVVCLFSPFLHPTPTEPSSLPHLHPLPWICPCILYSSSCNPLSSLSPPHSLQAIVRLFLTSMSLVMFCLHFSSVDYVPVKGEIIWYLSLTVWFISLSIMLSSS